MTVTMRREDYLGLLSLNRHYTNLLVGHGRKARVIAAPEPGDAKEVEIDRQLFLNLVYVQARDGEQLNQLDGGRRMPVALGPELSRYFTSRERNARELCARDGGLHGQFGGKR